MKIKKKKQLTLYDVKRRHLLIRRKRKSLTYRIGRVIRNSSWPRGKWPRSAQVDIRIAGISADAAAALFAMATCIRTFNEIIKGKNRA